MNTTTFDLPRRHALQRRDVFDWLFAALVLLGGGYAFSRYNGSMDVYEQGILLFALPSLIALGWFWKPLRALSLAVGAATLLAIALYARQTDGFGADLAAGEQVFFLKYMLSSQSAILWMSLLFTMSMLFYWGGFFTRAGNSSAAEAIGSKLAWGGVFMALVGTLVRWYESHQIGADIGHIPVSNLYEVFVLFCWMTTLFYLYYEQRFATRALGAYVMLVVSAAVAFLLWYTLERGAQEIQPLVPALQSWWMKIHVPANFVGYGAFALAAMVALAYLLKTATTRALVIGLIAMPIAIVALILAVRFGATLEAATITGMDGWARKIAGVAVFLGLAVALRGRLSARLPELPQLDDLMYKAIALGFAFFTIATILGAFWAAEAWGGYWSWDPKETWALIVWLNYAAWLHMRLMKGLRGAVSAWWALVGLLVTTFAFLGVNMFLSGLHSYGEL
ncbi:MULTISPECIES: c-type cytochrome biogenesis protein CcsB [unclassified Roseateles]|uniref:c-type cytochrome biogenesis protein CcsB n=1 Tax=unclassified Roseateles TaxID=2626991 RepID=UPI0006F9F0AC|nr:MULTISPECIES: c-type cytochrome biogenesis protein CcsB [unclassified Roseateles]KQW51542.1 cytochrome C assembly protein [Pelomonas sp. Root405]KRA77775.1 cytochrome C assembly protein [Pelomonas sp. Root662]